MFKVNNKDTKRVVMDVAFVSLLVALSRSSYNFLDYQKEEFIFARFYFGKFFFWRFYGWIIVNTIFS